MVMMMKTCTAVACRKILKKKTPTLSYVKGIVLEKGLDGAKGGEKRLKCIARRKLLAAFYPRVEKCVCSSVCRGITMFKK